jgi:micrococcal nuclease
MERSVLRSFAWIPLLLPLLIPIQLTGQTPGWTTCDLVRVIDGDTIVCAPDIRVRLILIDAPERSQAPWGQRAGAHLERLLSRGGIRLETDVQTHDRFGRLLAYVRVRGENINVRMVADGFAVLATYPPNLRHVDAVRAAQRAARAGRRGLWSEGGFECTPADRRRGVC